MGPQPGIKRDAEGRVRPGVAALVDLREHRVRMRSDSAGSVVESRRYIR
jgi:hypothetical protein